MITFLQDDKNTNRLDVKDGDRICGYLYRFYAEWAFYPLDIGDSSGLYFRDILCILEKIKELNLIEINKTPTYILRKRDTPKKPSEMFNKK